MTITIHPIMLYYWAFSIVFLTIYYYFDLKNNWNKFKKNAEAYQFLKAVYENLKQSPSVKFMIKQILSFKFLFSLYLVFCIISPILMIFTTFSIVKKLIGYKSKLQKEAEEEVKKVEEAKKEQDDWLRNEGVFADEEPLINSIKED